MTSLSFFQGVACCCLDRKKTVHDTIFELLPLKTTTSVHHNVNCFELELKNKYYQATVHLFDYDNIPAGTEGQDQHYKSLLIDSCHAVVLYGDGQTLASEQLDTKMDQLKEIGGEPRILICDGIDEECEAYKTIQAWCIENSFDLLLAGEENTKKELIDSLSAYKWEHRIEEKEKEHEPTADTTKNDSEQPQLDKDLLKKLVDFDSLLSKLSAYRDQPELRGNPEDKNIEEIAEILSGLLGDDVDNFLDNEDGDSNHNETAVRNHKDD